MKIKNVMVYTAAIKECLNPNGYRIYGDMIYIDAIESKSMTTATTIKLPQYFTRTINEQAIIIKNEFDHFYEFKLTNGFTLKDIEKIIFYDIESYSLKLRPENRNELFIEESTLVPYYQKQPKKLNLKKLNKNLLLDPRIKLGVELT